MSDEDDWEDDFIEGVPDPQAMFSVTLLKLSGNFCNGQNKI
jgi:hypothetical protein